MRYIIALLVSIAIALPAHAIEKASSVYGSGSERSIGGSIKLANRVVLAERTMIQKVRSIVGDGYIQGFWVFDSKGDRCDVLDRKLADVGSKYPPAHTEAFVKTTSNFFITQYGYFATNPDNPLTGSADTSWRSSTFSDTNQRFHIDLGSEKIIKKIYYENFHDSGADTDKGAKTFTFWGSNSASSFATLTYATDTGWTQLACSQATFDEHAAADAADPKYITVTNFTPYRYYAVKISNNYGDASGMGLRRIELQTNDAAHNITLGSNASALSPSVNGLAPTLTMAGTAVTSWSAGDSDDFSFASNPAGTDAPFSLVVLVNPTNTTNCILAGKSDDNLKAEYLMKLTPTDMLVAAVTSTGGWGNYIARYYNSALTSDGGSWHCYTSTFSGGSPQAIGGIKVYRDGLRVDDTDESAGAYSGMSNDVNPFSDGQGGSYGNSKNSIVLIISRELTAGEVRALSDALLAYTGR
jgi:hypothetical protein